MHPLQGQNYSSKKKCNVHKGCASDKIHLPRGGAKHNMPMDAVIFYTLAFSRGFYCSGVIFCSLLPKKMGLDTHTSEQSLAYLVQPFCSYFFMQDKAVLGTGLPTDKVWDPEPRSKELRRPPQRKLSALGQGDLSFQVPGLSAWSTAIGSLPMQPNK